MLPSPPPACMHACQGSLGRLAKQSEGARSWQVLLHAAGELLRVLLGDAAGEHPGAVQRQRRLEDDDGGDEVVVHERAGEHGRAEAVVHVGEPQLAPVGDVDGLVVEAHLEGILPRLLLGELEELHRHPLLHLPDHVDHLHHRRLQHLLAAPGHLHGEDGVAVVPGVQLQQVAHAGEEAELHRGVRLQVQRPGAALPQLRRQHVEAGAELAAVRLVLRLEPVDVARGEVEHDVVQRQHGELRERTRLDARVGELLPVPHRLHRRLREPPRHVAHR
uniref:Uncharacterized protein n=1 Tax=Triticum urartu TaxID=4572 RepID=A0A8R7PPU1_TRIUA